MKDSQVFLQHILESITAIQEYAEGLSKEEFLGNQEKQDAITRRVVYSIKYIFSNRHF